jgi:hypothetical protein
VFTNLREQPSTVVLIDRVIVKYGEAHIWLSQNLTSHEFVGSLSNQPPRTLDDPADEIHQLLVIRQEQGSGHKSHVFQISVHFQSNPFEAAWHARISVVLFRAAPVHNQSSKCAKAGTGLGDFNRAKGRNLS